jgi:hypothetical protein
VAANLTCTWSTVPSSRPFFVPNVSTSTLASRSVRWIISRSHAARRLAAVSTWPAIQVSGPFFWCAVEKWAFSAKKLGQE